MSSMILEHPVHLATVHELRPAACGPAPAVPVQRGAVRPEARRQQGSVRLTRRGRLVVFLTALVAVLVAGVVFGAVSVATDKEGVAPATEIVMVDEGDTLWGIAAAIADDGDVRAVMNDIERLNALDSSVVMLGQELRVPVAD